MALYDRIPLAVSPALGAAIRAAAQAEALSVTAWIARACERALTTTRTGGHTMTTYTLTTDEAQRYDDGDDAVQADLSRELRARFGRLAAGEPVDTEVRHPDGFIVSAHTRVSVHPR